MAGGGQAGIQSRGDTIPLSLPCVVVPLTRLERAWACSRSRWLTISPLTDGGYSQSRTEHYSSSGKRPDRMILVAIKLVDRVGIEPTCFLLCKRSDQPLVVLRPKTVAQTLCATLSMFLTTFGYGR